MVFLYLFLFSFSLSVHASDLLKEEDGRPHEKKTSWLLQRPYFSGDKSCQNESVVSVGRLSEPYKTEVVFSGKPVDPGKEKDFIKDDTRELCGGNSWNFPGRVVAFLEASFGDFTSLSTGFLIGEKHVLTAKRNLYINGKHPTSVTCFFGRTHDAVSTYGDTVAGAYAKPKKGQKESPCDFALLILSAPKGKQLGYLNPKLCDVSDSRTFWILGYPAYYYGDMDQKETQKDLDTQAIHQYKSFARKTVFDNKIIYHDAPTTAGQKGSPILSSQSHQGRIYHHFVGMHLSGAEDIDWAEKTKQFPCAPYKGVYVTKDFMETLEALWVFTESLDQIMFKSNPALEVIENEEFLYFPMK